MRALRGGLVGASPERPGDDVGGPDAALGQAHRYAADLLDRPADAARRVRGSRGSIGRILFGGDIWFAWWRTLASMAS